VTCRDVASDGLRGGTPVGNRGAPPRGVDVKPLGRRGHPGALGAPGSPPGPRPGRSPGSGPRDPDPGIRGPCPQGPGEGPRRPGPRSPGSRDLARGGFYINPSRRGPAVPRGGSGDLGSREGRKGPSGGPGRRTPLPGLRETPAGNRGAPARGVDVKPPPGPGSGTAKTPLFGVFEENPDF